MPNKTSDGEWLIYYRWSVTAMLTIVVSMVGYFGSSILKDQRWVHDQVILINERGAQNRQDIKDMKADAKLTSDKVAAIQAKLDRIDDRMP